MGVDYCAISIAAGNKNDEKVLTIGDARYLGLGCTLTDPLEEDCESSEEERKEVGKLGNVIESYCFFQIMLIIFECNASFS